MDEGVSLNSRYINIIALCEQGRIILRPNVLYTLEVVPGCSSCERIAEELEN